MTRIGEKLPRINSGDVLVLQPGIYPAPLSLDGLEKVTIQSAGAIFDGKGVRGRENGIDLRKCSQIRLEGLTFRNWGENGLYAEGVEQLGIEVCKFLDNGHSGLLTAFCNDVAINRVTASGSKEEHGVYLSSSGDRYSVSNLTAVGNARCGLQVNAVEDKVRNKKRDSISKLVIVRGLLLTDNRQSQIQFAGVEEGIIEDCIITGKCDKAISVWDDGYKPCKDVAIDGCRIEDAPIGVQIGKGSEVQIGNRMTYKNVRTKVKRK